MQKNKKNGGIIMKVFNLLFLIQFKGEGRTGMRENSILRVGLGIDDADADWPDMLIDGDNLVLFCDKLDKKVKCSGKNWEKYFSISSEPADGWLKVVIKRLTPLPVVAVHEGISNEQVEK